MKIPCKKMKILCVIDSLCLGGAQRQLIELAAAFREKGHNVSFLTYHHLPFFNPEVEQRGISITCIQESSYLKRLLKMRRFIRRGNYDAVLSFLEAANFISEVSGFPFRKWKLVVGERTANPGIVKSPKLRLYRWFHLFSDAVVANSGANMELVYQANPLLPKTKSHVLYNIIDFGRFRPPENFLFRRNPRLYLVVAARIRTEKNVMGLIEALSLLSSQERSMLRIDWYGEDVQRKELNPVYTKAVAEIQKRGLEQVIGFYAATTDILRIVQEADAVGLFSFWEGFPNTICEAMACAKPVVCSRVSDVPAFLSHNQNLLCDASDPQSIKAALSYLLKMDREKLRAAGEKNRNVVMKTFNREEIVNGYLRLLGAQGA